MKRLTVSQIKRLHTLLISETGGLDGVRDEGLLESAVNGPFQTFDSMPLYPTIEAKAARMGYALVKNHAFVDGNKRIGMLAMLTFLEMNGAARNCTDDEVVRVGLALANGSMDDKALLHWILA